MNDTILIFHCIVMSEDTCCGVRCKRRMLSKRSDTDDYDNLCNADDNVTSNSG